MSTLPVWSRSLAFLGVAFGVWMIGYALFATAFTISDVYYGARLPFAALIVLFLFLQLFMWWRLWTVIVSGGRFWPRRHQP